MTHHNTPCDLPMPGVKYDAGKPQFSLVPPLAHEAHAKVLTFGAAKYAPENWRKVDGAKVRYINAALRHINAHIKGEQLDGESGLPHLAHGIASLSFALELMLEDALKIPVPLDAKDACVVGSKQTRCKACDIKASFQKKGTP